MPDLPPPDPPLEQVALRRRLERVLAELGVPYEHEDRFWESDDGQGAVYGWGTRVQMPGVPEPVNVWFDGLDEDIAVSTPGYGRWWRRTRGVWHEWLDLSDLDRVLDEVEACVQRLLRERKSVESAEVRRTR
ncbi:hypothetical protein [Motilibacter deserti]|uniref:Uncharacterized protein n=1 Tax=Motilibacter deserti TaxID=2714956 RepID=A0ABX0GYH3_9ACTN|nr:hypothetical protein [Motilibacter deserti]NHC14731.1 hypothetical protein [Motilibacter deserti]